jgi:hypothetical protein
MALSERIRDVLVEYAGSGEYDSFSVMTLEYRKGDRAVAEIAVVPRAEGISDVHRFLKKQLTQDNSLAGAVYAIIAVSAEELFMLAAGRCPAGAGITVLCAVKQNRIEISMRYPGPLENPLDSPGQSGRDAVTFIKKHAEQLTYEDDGSANILKMTFAER